jgi:hypothetical protein
MLIDNYIYVDITKRNIGHYLSKGYIVQLHDKVKIKISDLPKTTKTKVKVKCDVCGNEKTVTYYSYVRNVNNYGYYACSQKCGYNKSVETFRYKYGKDSYTQTDEYKDKTKKTKLEKYLNEFSFRINRSIHKQTIFHNLITRMIKAHPLTYQMIKIST